MLLRSTLPLRLLTFSFFRLYFDRIDFYKVAVVHDSFASDAVIGASAVVEAE